MCIEMSDRTHFWWIGAMRTNIEIDDRLMQKAQRLSGLRTKRAVVEAGLQILVRLKEQEEILGLAGKVHWQGDLDQSRAGRGAR
jgi:Arc/MetJ family transcription regulator